MSYYRRRSSSIDSQYDDEHQHDTTEPGSRDFVVARLPLEMYRRRRRRHSGHEQQGNSDGEGEAQNESEPDVDAQQYPGHVRQIQVIELCFHPDFEPASPLSLHFTTRKSHRVNRRFSTVVEVWDPPPRTPALEPPNFALEYPTMPVYLVADNPSTLQQSAEIDAPRYCWNGFRRLKLLLHLVLDWWHARPEGVTYLATCFLLTSACFCICAPFIRPYCEDGTGERNHQPPSRSTPTMPHGNCSPDESLWSMPEFLFEIEDMMMLWTVLIPTSLLGMHGPFRQPESSPPKMSSEKEEQRAGQASQVEWSVSSSWAWSAETVASINDNNNLAPYAWVHAVSEASDRGAPLRDIEILLSAVCKIASSALFWGEKSRFAQRNHRPSSSNGPVLTPPLSYRDMRTLCKAAEDHLQKARWISWPDVVKTAPEMAAQAYRHLSSLLQAQERILNSTLHHTVLEGGADENEEGKEKVSRFTYSDYSFLAVDWQEAFSVAASPEDARWKVGDPLDDHDSGQIFSPLASQIIEAFYTELITAALENNNAISADDGSDSSSLSHYGGKEARYLQQACLMDNQHPGCQLVSGATGFYAGLTNTAAAWEAWVKFSWANDDRKEPDLVSLVRHLATADYIVQQILEAIVCIPPDWIEDQALLKSHTKRLTDLRATVLRTQKTTAITSLENIMEVHHRWNHIRGALDKLRRRDDASVWRGIKLPTPLMLVHMLQPLHHKLHQWSKSTDKFYRTVLGARMVSDWNFMQTGLVMDDEEQQTETSTTADDGLKDVEKTTRLGWLAWLTRSPTQ